MVGAGMITALAYDGIRIFRKIVPHKNLFLQIEDAFYWLVVIFGIFLLMLKQNAGEVRFFSVMGAFLGMGIYHISLSPAVNAVSDKLVAAIRYVVKLFLTILLTPFRLLYLLLRKPVQKTGHFFNQKRKKLLHLCKVCVKIKTRAFRRNLKILHRHK